MKRVLLLIVALTIAAGCAHLPAIVPDGRPAADPACDAVSRIFPSGDWQFSHAIKATAPGGKTSEMVGVSVLSGADNSIRCVLMTIEGLVLFSGRFDGKLIVERAVSPFDRPGFAEGLISDLSLLFFPPKAPVVSSGRLPDGARVVRFCSKKKVTTDLVLREDQTWAIYEYSSGSKLVRSVEAGDISPIEGGGGNMAAKNIMLKRPGLLGYQLDMRLVEAIRLSE
jgi:hypothetical protein